jgi:hypothetical protein
MGLNLAGIKCFFSVCVTKLLSMVLAANIFTYKNYQNICIWTIGLHFKKLLEYWNIKYQAAKLGKFLDYPISNTKLKLSDIGYNKYYRYPALKETNYYFYQLLTNSFVPICWPTLAHLFM